MKPSGIAVCKETIDLSSPIRRERVRGFQPPWRTVFVYKCTACGNIVKTRASSFIGSRPVPSIGAIRCGAFIDLR